MIEFFVIFMTFSVPIIAIVAVFLNKQTKLKHGILQDQIKLEKLKQENYLLETEKMKLELEKMRIENNPHDRIID